VFTPIEAAAGKSSTFDLVGGIGLLGMISFFFLPEGRAVDLKAMDEHFEEYLGVERYSETLAEESS
jgi:hypothetical protein